MSNPNAFVAYVTGLLATAILWGAAKAGAHLSTQTAALVAGGIVAHASAVVLWVGRNGLRAAVQRVKAALAFGWNGPAKK